MKAIKLNIVLILFPFLLCGQGKASGKDTVHIPFNISASIGLLESTFLLRHDTIFGSCFIITLDDKQFLITARHLFGGKKNNDRVNFSIYNRAKWIDIESKILIDDAKEIDVAVIPLNQVLSKKFKMKLDSDQILGTETFFFGFPYGFKQDSDDLNNGFPFPLVKRATISGFFGGKDIMGFFFDGHNNSGFSGGPIGYFDSETNEVVIHGIVSAYVNHKNEIVTPIGKFPFNENSGLFIGYGMKHAIDLIKR